MHWKKLGHLYSVENIHPKMVSHAANPLAVHLTGDVFRVFFSARDDANRSSVGAVDINIITRGIVQEHTMPVFQHGPDFSFYEHGVSIGNCYEANGRKYILFMGWQSPPGKHWRGDIGRLRVNDDLSLELDPVTPFMGGDESDPISLSYPWVIVDKNQKYRMWYGSTISWEAGNGEMLHVLKHAWSKDGENWVKDDRGIPYELGIAQAFSRPSVMIEKNGRYHMWFSYRSGTGALYNIGYATSLDGDDWKLDLQGAGIEVSDSGWDSEMIEYPFVFEHQDFHYMLYNGNGFGKSGFGLAVLEND